jgi:argininosuccinate synthase
MFGTVVFDGKGNSIVRSGKYWGAVDPDGKMVIPLKLTRRQMVADILKMMQDKGIQQIGEKDAYSLNIRMSQERYLLMLSDVVPDYLWDY